MMTTTAVRTPDPTAPAHPEAPVSPAPQQSDIPLIELTRPMPGFDDRRRFALVQLDEDGVLCALRSVDDPGLRFLVTPPAPFFPDYAPVVSDEVAAELGVDSPQDALLLVVLTAGRSLETSTANLLAPLVVNVRTRRAQQVILEGQDYAVAQPLVALGAA
ncbi:flagellar assembly protein FliW [Lapillicoccus jejuensis]|uniref:Flagellar assembly factor FliW n=1 Tax=Lapillicoccus jejuensis TaxID=402171 RepID=A0A542E498_9MICO|nr:flagellar assembly protein FliW [Lapillicoccus jejuensis]TQJ10178.1 flagellar assembly factor FliW [Lapillicoccus jejuensis]